jgi:hypothetical protein
MLGKADVIQDVTFGIDHMNLKSIQKSKNHQRRIFLDNYYRKRCLV